MTDPGLETERIDIASYVFGSNKSLASQVGSRGETYWARWKLMLISEQAKDLVGSLVWVEKSFYRTI